MRKFETNSVYSAELGEWVENYKIDGEFVGIDKFYAEQDFEVEFEEEKYEDEEDDENCSDCDSCEFYDECDDKEETEEIDDSTVEEYKLIYETVHEILSTEGCESCIGQIVCDFFAIVKNIGRQDAIDEMKDFVNFMDEDE